MTFRILSEPLAQRVQTLRLNALAVVILASETIEGRIVNYSADAHSGYTITLERKKEAGFSVGVE